MKTLSKLLPALLFVFPAAGLTYYLTLYMQVSSFTILSHSYRFSPLVFFPCFAAVLLLFLLLWSGFPLRNKGLFQILFSGSPRPSVLPFLPFLLFCFTPFLLQHYLNRSGLIMRMHYLAFFVILAFVFLKISLRYTGQKSRLFIDRRIEEFSKLPSRKRLLILFLTAFAVYNLCTYVLVSKGISFSGDEPYYLLTTHSLLKDGDINLANNYAQQDYFSFYSREKNPRLRLGMYARAGRKGREFIYPINLPGLSVLVLPFYWLSQFFKGNTLTFILKGSLSIWAVLLGLQIYLLSRDLWKKEKISLVLWFLFSFTAPVLFFSTHVYSEIPIALFSVAIFRKIRYSQNLSLKSLLLAGFLLALFPWFGVKYNLIFWPLLLVSVYFIWKKPNALFRTVGFLLFPFLSFLLFYYFLYALYGSFSPFTIYEGVMSPEKWKAFKEAVLEIPLRMRVDAFFDYFLDQRDGLLLYSPLYFFSFLGLVEIFRRSRKDLLIYLFIMLPYLLNYALFTHRQGYSPQGRILAPLSWIGIVFVGYFLAHNQKKIFFLVFGFFSVLSLASASILLWNPSFLYQPTTHEFTSRPGDFFVSLSNIRFFLPHFLPSFIKIDNTGYWPNYIWILATLGFIFIYILLKKDPAEKKAFYTLFASGFLTAAFFLFALYPRVSLHSTRVFHYSTKKDLGFYLFAMGKGVVAKNEGEFYLHREGSYRILFSSKTPLKRLNLTFGSEKGSHSLRLSFFDIPVFERKTLFDKKEAFLTPPSSYSFKNLHLYEITLHLEKHSPESLLTAPYFFQIIPVD